MQLAFLLQEIKSYSKVWKILIAATTVKEASDIVLTGFEKPKDQSDAVKVKRAEYGQKYYDLYATPSTPKVEEIVKEEPAVAIDFDKYKKHRNSLYF